jgi:phenylalanyl-tRNA synthetase beta chain
VLGNIDKKCAVAFFEINTEAFSGVSVAANKYKEPSRFPAIDIDLTYVADPSAIVFEDVVRVATEVAGELLSDVKLKYVYTDAEGVTAITFTFSFVSAERTLSKQEIEPTTAAITAALCELGLVFKV